MMRKRLIGGAIAIGLVGVGYAVRTMAAGIPTVNALAFSGVIEDATGPIRGSHNVQALLYDAATDGTLLCQTASTAVTVTSGRFTLGLPDACVQAVTTQVDVWIDLLVDGGDTGRTKIGAVPYAVNAITATTATNVATVPTAKAASGLAKGTTGGLQYFEATTYFYPPAQSIVAGPGCASTGAPGVVVCDCSRVGSPGILSAGAFGTGGVAIRESRPVSPTAWQITCADASGQDTFCSGYSMLCTKVGPGL